MLLHPFLVTGNVWQDVVPLLSNHHEVFTPTLLGHRGGPPVMRRPATIWDVVDAVDGYLDEHGLQRPHLVGNSAGGFVALELARRGRAATVCAFSPAGFWSVGDGSKERAAKKVRRLAMVCPMAIPFWSADLQIGNRAPVLVTFPQQRVLRRSTKGQSPPREICPGHFRMHR